MTRILVVDDEPHILALVTRALHADGHETVVAEAVSYTHLTLPTNREV